MYKSVKFSIMRRFVLNNMFFLALIAITTSCGSDSPTPEEPKEKPIASFTFEVNNETGVVTFTNTSQNALTYEWNFGATADLDEVQSEDVNPTYTYNQTGSYEVTLTAYNDDEYHQVKNTVDVTLPEAKYLNIEIDGKFTDWTDIPVREEAEFSTGLLKEVKAVATDEHIYIYMRGDASLMSQRNYIYLDMDNNPLTGNQVTNHTGYPVFDATIPGGYTGFDASRQQNGFFVWGFREEAPAKLGWDWIQDGVFVSWTTVPMGNGEVEMEWRLDLKYAETQLLYNPVFSNEELKNDPQWATSVSKDLMRLIVRFRKQDSSWAELDMFAPLEIKLGEYLFGAAE